MPNMPAVCNNCSALFPSGIVVENSTNITFRGGTVGPCPRCGGTGHIPDGVYNFFGNTIELLRGPERTVHELRRLAEILREAQQDGASADDIETAVRRDIPGLKPVIDLLPRNRGELYDFISMLAAIVSVIIAIKAMTSSSSQAPQTSVENITIEQVINKVVQYEKRSQTGTVETKMQQRQRQKIGRNDLCPCGSGKKYKRCHLQIDGGK